jgi:hypothetical protein
MNRWNPCFTGWQHKAHLITMPAAILTLDERMARVGATGSISKADVALADGRSEQGGKTLEANVVQLPHPALASARHIEQQMLATWRKLATVAHVLALAETHRPLFATYRRIYAFGSIRVCDADVTTWLVPCLELGPDGLVLSDRRVYPDLRTFRTDENDTNVAFVESMGNCADLACKGEGCRGE